MLALQLLLIGLSVDVWDITIATRLCKCRAAGIAMRWARISLRSALSEHWTAPIMLVILYRVLAVIMYRTVALSNATQLMSVSMAGLRFLVFLPCHLPRCTGIALVIVSFAADSHVIAFTIPVAVVPIEGQRPIFSAVTTKSCAPMPTYTRTTATHTAVRCSHAARVPTATMAVTVAV